MDETKVAKKPEIPGQPAYLNSMRVIAEVVSILLLVVVATVLLLTVRGTDTVGIRYFNTSSEVFNKWILSGFSISLTVLMALISAFNPLSKNKSRILMSLTWRFIMWATFLLVIVCALSEPTTPSNGTGNLFVVILGGTPLFLLQYPLSIITAVLSVASVWGFLEHSIGSSRPKAIVMLSRAVPTVFAIFLILLIWTWFGFAQALTNGPPLF